MNKMEKQAGFTLIEALMAMIIFSIGILSLFTMHTVAIRGNSNANALSTSSNMGADRLEQIIAEDYDNLNDVSGNGCTGLSDTVAPNSDYGPLVDGIYTYYWNVADDCTLTSVPQTTEQRPKHVRVVVLRDILGEIKRVEFDYIKQNLME